MIWDVAGGFFFFKIFPEVFPSSFSLKNYFRLILWYIRFTVRLSAVEKKIEKVVQGFKMWVSNIF